MIDKQTTLDIEKQIKHILKNPPTWTDGNSKTQLERIMEVLTQFIQEEREKVIAEFISGERCSDCGKLITDGSSGCCKDCWENI